MFTQHKKRATLLRSFFLFSLTGLFCFALLTGMAAGDDGTDDQDLEKTAAYHQGTGACSDTARAAFLASKFEAKDDYWIAVGNCRNYSDPETQKECLESAKEDYQEARVLSREQLTARLDICDELGEAPYDPDIDPDNFVDFEKVLAKEETLEPNLYFPLVPGTTRIYIAVDGEGEKTERIKLEVLKETKEILGVNCIVVRDRVWEFDEEGEKTLIEDTFDWYAQDLEGNVWYFGEIAKNYEDGELADLEGSWTADKDDAKAGYLMLKNPVVDTLYRQEFALGDAEDMARVVGFLDSLRVRGVTYQNVLVTQDFTPIEPDVLEYKYYAPGVGVVLEENYATGERVELKNVIAAEP
jgi:hypothetical protein